MQFVAENHRRCWIVRILLYRVNFDKKSSVPKEIPSEVEVSVVKMIVISQDN